MLAKTEMSGQEWLHHSLLAVFSGTTLRRRQDSPLNLPSCVHLCVALNKRQEAMAFGVKVQIEIHFTCLYIRNKFFVYLSQFRLLINQRCTPSGSLCTARLMVIFPKLMFMVSIVCS